MTLSFPSPTLPLLGNGRAVGMEENKMTDQERNQVLKMIADGKITPEQGLQLMQALDQESPTGIPAPAPEMPADEVSASPAPSEQPGPETDHRIEHIKSTVRRLWQIPLWIGIGITILSALGMYAVLHATGMNFWFYFLLLPLLLGVLVTALAAGSRQARWIFVDVHQKSGERPERIFLGFPLPLKLTAWFLRTFGPLIPQLSRTNVDDVIQVIETGFVGNEPLIVNVDEGEHGERVRVYIG
jgi:hypothetical protein